MNEPTTLIPSKIHDKPGNEFLLCVERWIERELEEARGAAEMPLPGVREGDAFYPVPREYWTGMSANLERMRREFRHFVLREAADAPEIEK